MKSKFFFFILFLVGLGISAYYLALFFASQPTGQLRLGSNSGWPILILLAIELQMIAHWLRARKSRLLLEIIRPTKDRTLFKGLAIGFLFNAVLPLRAGEFIRAHFVGRAMTISRSVVFMTILIERALDGLILGAAGAAVILAFRARGQVVSSDFGILLGLVVLAVVAIMAVLAGLYTQNRRLFQTIYRATGWFNNHLRDRLRLIAWSVIYGVHLVLSRARLGLYALLSAAMWAVYIASAVLIIWAVRPAVGWLDSVFGSLAAYISVAVPSGPAYLGSFHYFFSRMTAGLGLPAQTNFSLSAVAWMVLMVPVSLVGLGLLLTGRQRQPTAAVSKFDTLMNKLYRDTDITPEFSHFLDAYFAGTAVNQVISRNEMHGNFRLIKTFTGGSNAITALVWQDDNQRVKKFTLPQYRDKLAAQYDWLLERQNLEHMPRLAGHEDRPDYYAFDLAYEPDFIPLFDYIHSEDSAKSLALLERVIDFMSEQVYHPQPAPDPAGNLDNYIETKAIGKMGDTATMNNAVNQLLSYKDIQINGQTYANFSRIIDQIRSHPAAMKDLADHRDSPIHGDLTVDNIIVNPADGQFVVLDPNNENQVSDPVVDLAKLYQSLHSGYEFLRQLSRVEVNDSSIKFEENISSKYGELFRGIDQKLRGSLSPAAYRSLLFHEAVHYCRMLTYRATINPDTLPAFYAIAVRLFNQFYEQYQPQTAQPSTN